MPVVDHCMYIGAGISIKCYWGEYMKKVIGKIRAQIGEVDVISRDTRARVLEPRDVF